MPMEMKTETLTFRGSMAFIDINFAAPVRNVEAMLNGAGQISAMKVVGPMVRLAAQCKGGQDCGETTVMVSANIASA